MEAGREVSMDKLFLDYSRSYSETFMEMRKTSSFLLKLHKLHKLRKFPPESSVRLSDISVHTTAKK